MHNRTTQFHHGAVRGALGFTLMELMVSLALLVLMMVAVSRVFTDSSRAVSLSQVNMEMLGNVRAAQEQIVQDFQGLDRNGFLVIRSYQDPTDSTRRFDQVAFLANGSFVNRTGDNTANPFANSLTAHSAVVYYGHGILPNTTNSILADDLDQSKAVALDRSPDHSAAGSNSPKDQELTLFRHTTLLVAGANYLVNTNVPAYSAPFFGTNAVTVSGESDSADITSSRVAVAAMTPGQLMQTIIASKPGDATHRLEANFLCFRFKALANPNQSTVTINPPPPITKLVNGTFRMHPIFMQGCPSFKVEWTDGSVYTAGDKEYINGSYKAGSAISTSDTRLRTLKWYGLDSFAAPRSSDSDKTSPDNINSIEGLTEPALANNDAYTAIFSFDNKAKWPKALKISYRATDTNLKKDRLNGGREFVQIIKLPD